MNLSSVQLRRAAALQEKIEAMQNELASLLSTGAPAPSGKAAKKRQMSASGRKRIAAAQKARWAKQKATSSTSEKKAK